MKPQYFLFSKTSLTLCAGLLACLCSFQAIAADYEPNIERREIVTPGIDIENFELTAVVSMLSVQDYNIQPHFGLRLAYHAHEKIFIEGSVGQADIGVSSVERLFSDGSSAATFNLNTLGDRRYTDYHLSLGWSILPGYTSYGEGKTMIQNAYLIGGAGITNFAAQNNFTVNFGAGYRLLFNDSLALRVEARDYIVTWDTPPGGVASRQHNLALSLGASLFF